MLTTEIILSKFATPVLNENDRSDDEQYYTNHPSASGLPTMRFGGSSSEPILAHETGILALSEEATPVLNENDRSDDEQYYTKHPVASGLPTMRLR